MSFTAYLSSAPTAGKRFEDGVDEKFKCVNFIDGAPSSETCAITFKKVPKAVGDATEVEVDVKFFNQGAELGGKTMTGRLGNTAIKF